MRLKLTLLLAVLLLAACGSPEPPVEEQAAATATPPPVPTNTEPPPPPTEAPTLPPPPTIAVESDDEVTTDGDASAEPAEETVELVEGEMLALTPWPRDQFGYGAQSHAVIGDPAYSTEVVKNQLGLDWMKVQMRWADVQRAPDTTDWYIWDIIMEEAVKRDLYVMLSIVTSPEWSRADMDRHGPPDDPTLYYNFVTEVLNRYKGRVHAVEVWNEQNLDREWRTDQGVAPAGYVDFLAGASDAIKAVDENIIVISGALAPTGFHDPDKIIAMNDLIWYDEALTLGILDHVDCVGVHHNGYNLPPDVEFDEVQTLGSAEAFTFQGPWANPHESWSFATTLRLMAEKTQAVNPDMKLCVTEFGWASAEGYDEAPTGFEWVFDNSLEEQATYIVDAFQIMEQSGDVMLAFLFNFDFGNKGQGPTDDPVPYSIIDTQGIPRPAFGAVAGMEK